MRVRCVNLLGDGVFAAALVEIEDAMAPGTMMTVLEIASEPPLPLEPVSADEVEIVEATDADWEKLRATGFEAVKRA